jgi:hypothetical protein
LHGRTPADDPAELSAALLVVKKGSNTRLRVFSFMPGPLSITSMQAVFPSWNRRRVIEFDDYALTKRCVKDFLKPAPLEFYIFVTAGAGCTTIMYFWKLHPDIFIF